MTLTNGEILSYFNALIEKFNQDNQKYIPVRIGFAIQKNIANLMLLTQEIEKSRLKILEEYGTYIEDQNYYKIKEENISIVNQELKDLLDFKQDVDIKVIKLSQIEDLEFTLPQVEALMFMIEE